MPMNWKQDLLSWEAEQAAATSRMSHTLRRVTGEGGRWREGGRERQRDGI